MTTIGEIATIMIDSQGGTVADMHLKLARAAYEPGDPELLFVEWVYDNQDDLKAACAKLGVEPPTLGKGLYDRLKEAVMPVLVEQAK